MHPMMVSEKKKALEELKHYLKKKMLAEQMAGHEEMPGEGSEIEEKMESPEEETLEEMVADGEEHNPSTDQGPGDDSGDSMEAGHDDFKSHVQKFLRKGGSIPTKEKGTAVMISVKSKPKYGKK